MLSLLLPLIFATFGTRYVPGTYLVPISPDELTGEQVVEKGIEASGGREAFEKLKSRHIQGVCELKSRSAKGTLEGFHKAPNRKLEIASFPDLGDYIQGYDGKTAWSKDPTRGLRSLEGPEAAFTRREAVFNAEIRWKEIFKEAKNLGKKKIEGRDAIEVEMIPYEGKPVSVCYDPETFLPFLMKTVVETSEKTLPVRNYLSDYREVDGIKLPFTTRQVVEGEEILVRFEKVKHNVEIDDAKFQKPEEGE